MQVRGLVNQKLEEARNNKLIGASLDAKVYLHASSKDLQQGLISMCGSSDVDHLKRIVLTSQVQVLQLMTDHVDGFEALFEALCELSRGLILVNVESVFQHAVRSCVFLKCYHHLFVAWILVCLGYITAWSMLQAFSRWH